MKKKSYRLMKTFLTFSLIVLGLCLFSFALSAAGQANPGSNIDHDVDGKPYEQVPSDFFCQVAYVFDTVSFLNKNYAMLQWTAHNSTHYAFYISMYAQRLPGGYWLIGEVNKFDIDATITMKGNTYHVQQTNVNERYQIFFTYASFFIADEIQVRIQIACNNTHNSDSGDKTTFGSTSYLAIARDPNALAKTFTFYFYPFIISLIATLGIWITMRIMKHRAFPYRFK